MSTISGSSPMVPSDNSLSINISPPEAKSVSSQGLKDSDQKTNSLAPSIIRVSGQDLAKSFTSMNGLKVKNYDDEDFGTRRRPSTYTEVESRASLPDDVCHHLSDDLTDLFKHSLSLSSPEREAEASPSSEPEAKESVSGLAVNSPSISSAEDESDIDADDEFSNDEYPEIGEPDVSSASDGEDIDNEDSNIPSNVSNAEVNSLEISAEPGDPGSIEITDITNKLTPDQIAKLGDITKRATDDSIPTQKILKDMIDEMMKFGLGNGPVTITHKYDDSKIETEVDSKTKVTLYKVPITFTVSVNGVEHTMTRMRYSAAWNKAEAGVAFHGYAETAANIATMKKGVSGGYHSSAFRSTGQGPIDEKIYSRMMNATRFTLDLNRDDHGLPTGVLSFRTGELKFDYNVNNPSSDNVKTFLKTKRDGPDTGALKEFTSEYINAFDVDQLNFEVLRENILKSEVYQSAQKNELPDSLKNEMNTLDTHLKHMINQKTALEELLEGLKGYPVLQQRDNLFTEGKNRYKSLLFPTNETQLKGQIEKLQAVINNAGEKLQDITKKTGFSPNSAEVSGSAPPAAEPPEA